MSAGQLSRSASRSTASRSQRSAGARHTPPPAVLTPENQELGFEPCAATGSFFLYAQRNVILCLHHDTLAIERRFELHHEDVQWICVDNVSERGAGRLAVSYDIGNTAIVWDIFTGGEVARFAAYDQIRTASFMRNGNIAFGNNKGSVILFEPSTSEHINARTIFDPITSIAPASDCRTFALGYFNGSILIATLQPAFTILHTLTTSRAPARITGLAWHGTSSKQKTDMLATQTSEGDMRVWSVPKVPHQDSPNIIRVLTRSESAMPGACWFAWSKNGRIVQHCEGETRSWDVRTKKVTYEIIPTIDSLTGIANYGPTATLFTLGRNHTVQQYDINPTSTPLQVASVQHVPANTPPTPPTMLEERKNPYADARAFSNNAHMLPTFTDGESSADEGGAMSPLQKIAKEMDSLDQLESELRDKVMPLSPSSSRASSTSSKSSGGRAHARYLYDRPGSSRASTSTGLDGTEFSFSGPPARQNYDNMSIRSGSTRASRSGFRSSNLRQEIIRSPQEAEATRNLDLFPFLKHRVRDVPFRTPHYGNTARTPELLQREMLSTVFGWNDDITSLIRSELSRHSPGSATYVLLSKWMGDESSDNMAAMLGSKSMTSTDWMLLALSSIGNGSQKQVGEAFVQRLLEKGDVHPAVAILIGLGEHNDAIEVYVSQTYYMEAVLLACLLCNHDWQRQSYLLRKWGEVAVQSNEPELAVRCFSCCSIETSEPWRSPRAQDAVYAAQQERFMQPLSAGILNSPPLSPPSRSGSGRIVARNPSLKLITSFGDKGAPLETGDPTPLAAGVTPIAESALSPGAKPWLRPGSRGKREPSSARTATPGGYTRRKRLPSKSDIERARQEAADMATPRTAQLDHDSKPPSIAGRSRRTSSVTNASSGVPEPTTALRYTTHDPHRLAPGKSDDEDRMPSPAKGVFTHLRQASREAANSPSRIREGLEIQVVDTRYSSAEFTPAPTTHDLESIYSTMTGQRSRAEAQSPQMPKISPRTMKAKAIDDYIDSVEEARNTTRRERAESRKRGESRSRRAGSRMREQSSSRRKEEATYIRPAKKSPTSPVPMSPEEIAQANKAKDSNTGTLDAEEFYKLASPVEPGTRGTLGRKESLRGRREPSRDGRGRGRSSSRALEPSARSPSSPIPLPAEHSIQMEEGETESDGHRVRFRTRSCSRRQGDDLQSRRQASRSRARERSTSRRPGTKGERDAETPVSEYPRQTQPIESKPRMLSRKELAARELEERRLSLARRPSAPHIPTPGEPPFRPGMSPRSHTELGDSPTSFLPPMSRSHTVDPDAMMRHAKITGTSTTSAPIGLPATPRAMRHPRYMSSDPDKDDTAPPVPMIPGNFSELSSTISYNSSQLSTSTNQTPGSENSKVTLDGDAIGPLLPSTVFGQKAPQGPPRSASAPPEHMGGLPAHPAYKPGISSSNRRQSLGKHIRKISPPDAGAGRHSPPHSGIDEALSNTDSSQVSQVSQMSHVVIIPEEAEEPPPPSLPELQHLAGPPPPPPAPTMYNQQYGNNSGMINIVMDDNAPSNAFDVPASLPHPMERVERSFTTSPSHHRRGRGSVSETIGSRWRGFGDRMRSTSRTKSPQLEPKPAMMPYETVLPSIPQHFRRESFDRAKSPYEQAMAALAAQNVPYNQQVPPPPPPPPAPPAAGMEGKFTETAIPPPLRSQSAAGGYRNPKDIRANMPPQTLQQGVHQSMQGGFL